MDTQPNPWASPLSKVCVLVTFILILAGAAVTTAGAGMVSPNAPHVGGVMVFHGDAFRSFEAFLEHYHRYIAMFAGVCVGALAAMVWRNWPAYFVAISYMGLAGWMGKVLAISNVALLAQLRVWPAMVIFAVWIIVAAKRRGEKPGTDHWLVLAAFGATCVQAALGTLRVESETAGSIGFATNIRTFHGVFAQAYLALLVVIAARLSPVWRDLGERPAVAGAAKFRRMAFVGLVMYLIQLACAAYLRHRPGLWQAIASWPSAQGDPGIAMAGSWLPATWSHAVGVHFLHTRILPVLLLGHFSGMAIGILKRAGEPRLSRPAIGILILIVLQFVLGALMFALHAKAANGHPHPHITNTHVMIGALLAALLALIYARAGRLRGEAG